MTQATKYRKKPVVIEAIQWTGENFEQISKWTNQFFDLVDERDRDADPGITAQVWDELHSTWVGVKTDDWIIKGVKGEFYPCDGEVFEGTYEEA